MDGGKIDDPMAILLRDATRTDIPLLRHWDSQPHKKEADPNSDWQWETEVGREAPGRRQLIAELNARPIGYVEILRCALDEEQYWGAAPDTWAAIDIWLGDASDIGHGYGTRILQMAIQMCFKDDGIDVIVLDPLATNIRARRFYEKNGFEFVEERRIGVDDCAIYRLTRERWTSFPRLRLASSAE